MNIESRIVIERIVALPTVKTNMEYSKKFHTLRDELGCSFDEEKRTMALKEYFELFAEISFSKGYGKVQLELRRIDPNELLFVMGGLEALQKYRDEIPSKYGYVELHKYCYKKYLETLPPELKLLLEIAD